METAFVRDLVVVTVKKSYGDIVETKVVIRNKLKDFAEDAVANYGTNITIYYNKAYISFAGGIEAGEYLGQIDIDTLLND